MCQSFSWPHNNGSLCNLTATYRPDPISAPFDRMEGVRMSLTNLPICHRVCLPSLLGHFGIGMLLIFSNMRIYATKQNKNSEVSYFNFIPLKPQPKSKWMLKRFKIYKILIFFKCSLPNFSYFKKFLVQDENYLRI